MTSLRLLELCWCPSVTDAIFDVLVSITTLREALFWGCDGLSAFTMDSFVMHLPALRNFEAGRCRFSGEEAEKWCRLVAQAAGKQVMIAFDGWPPDQGAPPWR